ncbi:hypothetical protein [Pseudohaliea rubra]|uniref:Uncharacterized protein n=1 Tax=Pseudohaliea rubra DSM 19751 TaxID=1265313 RepID=A0A095VU08_9GAMM|nr:hypothetical protein [Pseudohaliea rubra]KGE04543.1 hypothetical protein HRUBRA_00882 [Pseudohaliea rubra DSM 19751]
MLYLALAVIVVLQVYMFFSLRKTERAIIEVRVSQKVTVKGLDWIDGGLASSLENYRGYGE